jgi:2-polyprenyl-3-methyl-5-hydroxy-6-metoxy-1,4-benzoquinol methylase
MAAPTNAAHCLSCGGTHLKPWAKATDLEYFTTSEIFDYSRCENCEALSISPVPSNQLDTIYPENYYAFEGGGSPLEAIKQWLDRRRLGKLLATIPGDKLHALDVGGGSGWMLDVLKRTDKRVQRTTVVDTNPVATQAAIKKGHAAYCGPLEKFPTSERFDVILLLNLIEHVEDPAALLVRARELLSDNGRILLKTPNVDCWEGRALRHNNWGAYHCPRHWVLFTPESLRDLLRRNLLHVDSLQLTQGATFWASTVLMAMHHRGWVKLGPQNPIDRHPLHGILCAGFAAVDIVRSAFTRTSQMFVVISHAQT